MVDDFDILLTVNSIYHFANLKNYQVTKFQNIFLYRFVFIPTTANIVLFVIVAIFHISTDDNLVKENSA